MDDSLNVFDEELVPCGTDPVTGFYRDGCCNASGSTSDSYNIHDFAATIFPRQCQTLVFQG